MNMNKTTDEKFTETSGIFITTQEKQKKRGGGAEIIIESFTGENRTEPGAVK